MGTRWPILILVSLALIAQFSEARAQGTITGLTVSPSPKVCALETITVSGTGSCGTFTLSLGDKTPIVHLPGNFPISVFHYYTKAQPITLTAQGQGNCTGTSSFTLQVVGGPMITGMFLFSRATPGGYVLLTGTDFGNTPVQNIHLYLSNPGPNPPDIVLQNVQSGDSWASGEVPDSITGVLDQPANLAVVASCGAVSPPYQVNSMAKRDIALAPPDHVDCSAGGGTGGDSCGASGSDNWPPECFWEHPFAVGGGAVSGFHASGWFGGRQGSDKFWANLKNGWVVEGVANFEQFDVSGQVNLINPDGSQINWSVDSCGMASYTADMMISGPIGVPY